MKHICNNQIVSVQTCIWHNTFS